MDDLIARLRTEKRCEPAFYKDERYAPINPDGPEAADTIEALTKRVAELEGALERISLRDGRGHEHTICHQCSDSSREASQALKDIEND